MDTLRGNFGAYDSPLSGSASADSDPDGLDVDDAIDHTPPPQFGADERRMQVRAYNFWAGLLEDRNFPHVEELDPEALPDFGPHGVLLDFSHGIENPAVTFLGNKLAEECGAEGVAIGSLADVPARSLLSRITDHYMQIIANQAPIGFEAEFINQRGATIAYRGILLPFSSDDDTIDFIFGVINWKELADARTADALLLEIGQALDAARPAAAEPVEMADWADGPGGHMAPTPAAGAAPPMPSFDLDDLDDHAALPESASLAEPASLADWLAAAREQALQARSVEDRTRSALYEAIGRAHDFALAAAASPDDFTAMLEDAGMASQERAPMTPVVKLVFGADYDKTRVTEYATALVHAQRIGLGYGALAAYLARSEGGLKGVVAAERLLRRKQEAQPQPAASFTGPRKAIANKLRAIAPRGFDAITPEGDEFALVMVRRIADGAVVMLGEVPGDSALMERAARRIMG